jgi:GAF domain-containing protein
MDAQAAHEVDATEVRLQRLVNMIVDFAVDTLGADGATLTVGHDGGYSTVRTSDSRLVHIDEAQYESRAGPCIQASRQDEPVVVEEFDDDSRWQPVAELARELGVHSSLSVGVRADHDRNLAASLNFYSRTPRHFGEERINTGRAFAEQLGTALSGAEMHRATARLAAEMSKALQSRAVIDQAKGMIMRERGCDADQAFDVLRSLSQNRNVRLAEIAAELVAAGQSGEPYDLG